MSNGAVLFCRVSTSAAFPSLVALADLCLHQGAHWKTHRPNCRAFSSATTVTLKPTYHPYASAIPIADLTRGAQGYSKVKKSAVETLTPQATSGTLEDNKHMIIKIQVPPPSRSSFPMANSFLIYDKTRDFMCNVSREHDAKAYDTVAEVVRTRGVGGGDRGSKAYFVAELKNPDELVVKVSEPLAEQPF